MLPVHDQHGNIAGFLGRARPGAAPEVPEVPKYLNSPETSSYHKGSLLRLDHHINIAAANRHHARDPQRTLKLLQTA